MNMRKLTVVVVLAAGLGLAGLQQATAKGWGGGYGNCGSCPGYGQNYQMLDEATRTKVDAFRAETVELRKQMAMKRAEKRALMSSQTPDPTEVAKVEGELFDLRLEMQEKASEAGMPVMGGGPGSKRGGGRGGPGYGMKPCYRNTNWN